MSKNIKFDLFENTNFYIFYIKRSIFQAERREAVTEFVDECMRRLIPEEYSDRERIVAAELLELAGKHTFGLTCYLSHSNTSAILDSGFSPLPFCLPSDKLKWITQFSL